MKFFTGTGLASVCIKVSACIVACPRNCARWGWSVFYVDRSGHGLALIPTSHYYR
ncbi:hypothetical protein [Desulfobotulus alkaliphilus]|uniref:hypothetical protein n=1 Tax=Desulfobotulus alkaliphilus TaxID=622671 RepID=UPI00164492AE|nr:hypothetical protein [Desulfobotulus alkaliphilus]